ncbi:MAG: hypothetical protein F6J93_16405 [Oscillatoria sp. SIO1A7]|nr:hypothetical protein [Oscillatoria sp. SIO1A7]
MFALGIGHGTRGPGDQETGGPGEGETRGLVARASRLRPIPHTLHPTPYTPHPTP